MFWWYQSLLVLDALTSQPKLLLTDAACSARGGRITSKISNEFLQLHYTWSIQMTKVFYDHMAKSPYQTRSVDLCVRE